MFTKSSHTKTATFTTSSEPYSHKPASYNATLRLESGFFACPSARLRCQLSEYRSFGLGNASRSPKGHL